MPPQPLIMSTHMPAVNLAVTAHCLSSMRPHPGHGLASLSIRGKEHDRVHRRLLETIQHAILVGVRISANVVRRCRSACHTCGGRRSLLHQPWHARKGEDDPGRRIRATWDARIFTRTVVVFFQVPKKLGGGSGSSWRCVFSIILPKIKGLGEYFGYSWRCSELQSVNLYSSHH
jgi:hypothetical protein